MKRSVDDILVFDGVGVNPRQNDVYWLGSNTLGFKGVKFPGLRVYQVDPNTVGIADHVGNFKDLRLNKVIAGNAGAPGDNFIVGVNDTQSIAADVGNNFFIGFEALTTLSRTASAMSLGGLFGASFEPRIGAANNQNWTVDLTNSFGLVGSYCTTHILAGATGTLALAVGVMVNCDHRGMTTTESDRILIMNPALTAPATITTLIGLKIQDLTVGGTNYAISTGLGPSHFGDIVDITRVAWNGVTSLKVVNAGVGVSTEAAVSVGENATNKLGGIEYLANSFTLGAGYESYRANCLVLGTSSGVSGGISIVSPVATTYVSVTVAGYRDLDEIARFDTTGLAFVNSIDSASVANKVSLSGFEIAAGHRGLAISSEEVVIAIGVKVPNEVYPMRINGVTKYVVLAA